MQMFSWQKWIKTTFFSFVIRRNGGKTPRGGRRTSQGGVQNPPEDQVRHLRRRIRLIEGKTKSLRLKSNLERT
jgi:hypothetical protein